MIRIAAALILIIATAANAQTFRQHRTLLRVGPQPSAIAAADLTGDGLPEIVTADRGQLRSPLSERPANNELSLHIAEGDLNYRYLEPLQTGFAPYAIAFANIDARKALDIVAVSFMDNRQSEPQRDISLFLNLNESLFERKVFTISDDGLQYKRMNNADGQPVFTTPGLTSVAIADLNGDGLRDLVSTAWSADRLFVFPGAVDTFFGEPMSMPLEGGPRQAVLGDFNNDGQSDCAVALYEHHEIAVMKGASDLTFADPETFNTRGYFPHTLRATDMNKDGALDLIVSHCDTDDSIVIFVGAGDGSFPTSQVIELGEDRSALEEEIRDFIVRDLDGDGDMDIAAACWASARITLLWNNGAQSAGPFAFERENIKISKGRPRAICAEDFNADGKIDLAAALWEENAVALFLAN